LLNNADIITLIIYVNEVTSLMFKTNINPANVNEKIDYQTEMKYTPKSFLLSLNAAKVK
jgi:hypothetical protein